MENLAKNPDKRIIFLDYLRIFAFISVLFGHLFYDYFVNFANNIDIHETPRLIAQLLLPLIKGGGAGVVVFFLVSGYIITHVLQTERPLEFLIKRIFRIYPLYIVAVLIQFSPVFMSGQMPDIFYFLVKLSLMGDFFGASYTLNGVEWTLRVEMLFYFYMTLLHTLKFIGKNKRFLPYIYMFTVALCAFLAPIPSIDKWSEGYLTIYGPFLLLGSMIYMLEKKSFSITFFVIFLAIIFYHYFRLIGIYQKIWMASHFAILAFLIFAIFWLFRARLILASWTILLSDMTYAVYLFHNWFFAYIKSWLSKLNLNLHNYDFLALLLLLVTCYLMTKFVEKPGTRLGRFLIKKYTR